MSKKERQSRILAELRVSPTIRISELASEFGVSYETIRRDLEEMGQSGLINRTYGGAVAARPLGLEPAWDERFNVMTKEREYIASQAIQLIQPREVVMIDGGATTLRFAHRLAAERNEVTVITNSFTIAVAVANNPTMKAICCPGVYDSHDGCVVGPDAISFLSRFHANRVVIGASGITSEGPNEAHPGIAAVKRAMLDRGQERVLLLDHTKFDRPNLEIICPLTGIDRLVSNRLPSRELIAALRRAHVTFQDTTASNATAETV